MIENVTGISYANKLPEFEGISSLGSFIAPAVASDVAVDIESWS